MNKLSWKNALTNTPETTVEVNASLHQDIMRAVKLAEPAGDKPGIHRSVPAWGATVFAVLVLAVIFYPSRMTTVLPVSTSDKELSQFTNPVNSFEQLTDSLLALSMDAPVNEQKLREELERLKSDLERFDFRS